MTDEKEALIPLEGLFNLAGKVAIVTGGGQGMGRAIGCRLAEAGAAIVIAARHQHQADASIAVIEANGGKGLAIAADVAIPDDINRVVHGAVEMFGRIDILVNNAGGMHPFTPFLDVDEALWQSTLERNLKSAHFMSQRVIREMVTAGRGGRIVNIASVEAMRPFPRLAAYSASKAGIVSLTQALAFEFASDAILVNAIAPGPIRTPNTATAMRQPGVAAMLESRIPLGRIGSPDDVAKAALFLASDAASYVTGAILTVDGGFMLV